MSDDADAPNAQSLEARIAALIEPSVRYLGFELVRVAVLGRVRQTVQVMADRADGSLIRIEDCQLISEQVGAVLDVYEQMPAQWTLEVSSAGIDRPLTRPKDWVRFAGHRAKAELHIAIDGRRRFAGVVLGTTDEAARMKLDDGTEVALPFADIRRAQLVLTDALIAATAPARDIQKELDA